MIKRLLTHPALYCTLPEREHNMLNRTLMGVAFIVGVPLGMVATPYVAGVILLFVGG